MRASSFLCKALRIFRETFSRRKIGSRKFREKRFREKLSTKITQRRGGGQQPVAGSKQGATGSLQLRASNLQPVARSLQPAAASSGACSSPASRSPLLSGVAQGVGAAPAAAPFPLTCLYLNNCSLSLQHTLEGATSTRRGPQTFREKFSRKEIGPRKCRENGFREQFPRKIIFGKGLNH